MAPEVETTEYADSDDHPARMITRLAIGLTGSKRRPDDHPGDHLPADHPIFRARAHAGARPRALCRDETAR